MGPPLDLLQRGINAEDVNTPGWFDPFCCILYLREVPRDVQKYDPNTQLMQMARMRKLDDEETEDLKAQMTSEFSELLESLPKELVDEWKRERGSDDYVYDPSKEFTFTIPAFLRSARVISETDVHVFVHEYCHYLQFLRTGASPMLIWALLNLVQKASLVFRFAKQTGLPHIRFPIKLDEEHDSPLRTLLDDPAAWKILSWHYSRPNFLSANDIREAEAEFNTLLLGKHSLRFRRFPLTGHPVTTHFREINKTAPQYARAYLETEAALGDLAPGLFPLITYFALSMPFKRYSRFNIEVFEPVYPEEALQAAIGMLKSDLSNGLEYAKYARQLYRQRRGAEPSRVVTQFCKRVCKANHWMYPSARSVRRKWIERIPANTPFLLKLRTVFSEALALEKRYGEEVFTDPLTENHQPLLRTIPLPPILLPGKQGPQWLADDFWTRDFLDTVTVMRLMMGFAFSLFVNADVSNECPHTKCRFRDLNLCHGVFTYPQSVDECGFTHFVEDLSDLPFSTFLKRESAT